MSMVTIIRTESAGGPDPDTIATIAEFLRSERLVAMPTDTIYGLHGLAGSAAAVMAMGAAKGRPSDQPYLVLASDIDQIRKLGVTAPEESLAALAKIWPAPLTALLPVEKPFPATRERFTVAVRIPDTDWLREVVSGTGPIASTSLNRHGERPVSTLPETDALNQMGVALGIDMGSCEGQPSTIVDFTETSPRVVRNGEFRFTQKLWKRVWKSL